MNHPTISSMLVSASFMRTFPNISKEPQYHVWITFGILAHSIDLCHHRVFDEDSTSIPPVHNNVLKTFPLYGTDVDITRSLQNIKFRNLETPRPGQFLYRAFIEHRLSLYFIGIQRVPYPNIEILVRNYTNTLSDGTAPYAIYQIPMFYNWCPVTGLSWWQQAKYRFYYTCYHSRNWCMSTAERTIKWFEIGQNKLEEKETAGNIV